MTARRATVRWVSGTEVCLTFPGGGTKRYTHEQFNRLYIVL